MEESISAFEKLRNQKFGVDEGIDVGALIEITQDGERAHYFIGPTAAHISLMGDKIRAKRAVAELGVPVIPGSDGSVANAPEAAEAAKRIGFPVLIKAASGGGGRGMKIAQTEAELAGAVATARSEARAAFGDDTVYLEKYLGNPRHIEIQLIGDAHCNVIVSPSASPFVTGKHETHLAYALDLAREHNVTIAVCNQVGGNDDLVFDGGSFVTTSKGIIGELPLFETGSIVFDTSADAIALQSTSDDADCVHALCLGIRDYVEKTGHMQTYVGLSGGIDSALTATLAVAALGCEHVTGILMPSRYSSLGSIEDAEALAENLGNNHTTNNHTTNKLDKR